MLRGKTSQQKEAKKLRRKGKSLNEIAAILDVSKSSASIWVRGVILTCNQRERLKQKEIIGAEEGRKILSARWRERQRLFPKLSKSPCWPNRSVDNFFDVWTPEMAYVLGYFTADGTMYRNKRGSCYIGFVSVDREQIEMIKRIMDVKNIIEEYQPKNPNQRRSYTLQIGSKRIFKRLESLGFTPNKSLTIRLPSIPDNVLSHFVRGNLDGDGCVEARFYQRKDRPSTAKVLSVRFYSGSKPFLIALRKKIQEVAYIKNGVMQAQSAHYYVLRYGVRSARQLYDFMYPTNTVPHLIRKRLKFEEFFNIVDP